MHIKVEITTNYGPNSTKWTRGIKTATKTVAIENKTQTDSWTVGQAQQQ